jgi:hypothetical protein
MAPWLTFVAGIIVGLVIGWVIDMLYRRAPRPDIPGPAEAAPGWTQPLPPATAAPRDEDHLDVPPGSESEEATEEVDWRALSARVDEVAAEVDLPAASTARSGGEPPDEGELPPPPAEEDGLPRGQ